MLVIDGDYSGVDASHLSLTSQRSLAASYQIPIIIGRIRAGHSCAFVGVSGHRCSFACTEPLLLLYRELRAFYRSKPPFKHQQPRLQGLFSSSPLVTPEEALTALEQFGRLESRYTAAYYLCALLPTA